MFEEKKVNIVVIGMGYKFKKMILNWLSGHSYGRTSRRC